MTTSYQKYPRGGEEREEEEIITTVLPPVVTTSYNSPISYPIHHYHASNTDHHKYHPGYYEAQRNYQPQYPTSHQRVQQRSRVETGLKGNTEQGIHSKLPQSRVEYFPFERKKKGYETRQIIQKVPVQKTIVQYQAVKKINYVPKEKVITDYYVIEHQTAYIPRNIQEKIVEYIPVQKYGERIEYKPVEKQVVHYPKDCDPSVAATISNRHSNINGNVVYAGSIAQSHKLSNVNSTDNQINKSNQSQTINQSKIQQSLNNTQKEVNAIPNQVPIKPNQQNLGVPTTDFRFVQSTYSLGQSQGIQPQFVNYPSASFQSFGQQSFGPQGQTLINSYGMPYQNIIFTNEIGEDNNIPTRHPVQFQNQFIITSLSNDLGVPPLNFSQGMNINPSSQFLGIHPIINPLAFSTSPINLSYPLQQYNIVQQSQIQHQQNQQGDSAQDNEDISDQQHSNNNSQPVSSVEQSQQIQSDAQN